MDASPAISSRLIGAIFVERGLITEAQLEKALAEQAESGERLGEILVQSYGVPRLELASALAEQWADMERPRAAQPMTPMPPSDAEREADDLRAVSGEWTPTETQPRRPIGEIFLERGLVTADQLDAALAEQQATGERLGEVLVSQGIVDRVDLAGALADQWANLPKLRPPSPDGETPRAASISNAAAEELRGAVQDLSARLEEMSARIDAGASAPNVVDDAAIAGLRVSFEEFKAWAEDERTIGRDTRERLEEAVRRLDMAEGVAGRLDAVEQRLDQDATAAVLADTAATLRHDIDALAAAVQLLDGQATGSAGTVQQELEAFRHGLEARDEHAAHVAGELAGRLAALESRPAPEGDPSAAVERDELRGLLVELGSRLDERVGELHARIEAHAAEGFDTDAAQNDADRHLGDRVDHLAASMDALAARLDGTDAHVREQLDAHGSTSETGEGHVAALRAELNATLDARLTDLAGRMDSSETKLRERLNGLAASYEALLSSSGDGELRRRVDRLTETVAALEQRPEHHDHAAAHADMAGELHAALDGRIAEVHGRIDAVLPGSEELRLRVDALAVAVDSMHGQVHAHVEATLDARLAELRSELDAERGGRDHRDAERAGAEAMLRDRLEALAAELAGLAGTANSVAAMRHEVDHRLAEGFGSVGHRLDAVEMRMTGVEDVAHQRNALDTPTRDDLLALEAAVDARLGALQENLATGGSEALRASVEALEQRVDSQTAAIDEQSRATERAVRKGLASIGERLAGTEAAYSEAGNALRRSIERLGWAIEDADRAIASPVPDETSVGHVIFAPTADGYRLLARDGVGPTIGEVVELDGVDGLVSVERVGLSPLPFDRRPCLFVERWRPQAPALDA